jgi:hypothetical protein
MNSKTELNEFDAYVFSDLFVFCIRSWSLFQKLSFSPYLLLSRANAKDEERANRLPVVSWRGFCCICPSKAGRESRWRRIRKAR